jgi:hypothetical protein
MIVIVGEPHFLTIAIVSKPHFLTMAVVGEPHFEVKHEKREHTSDDNLCICSFCLPMVGLPTLIRPLSSIKVKPMRQVSKVLKAL